MIRENTVDPLRRIRPYLLVSMLGFFVHALPASPQTASVTVEAAPQQVIDGQHDFDFHFGTWNTHIRRLQHPLSGSDTWIELNGTVTVRKIWDGRANLEELDTSNGTTHFKGLTLFLYNPEAHQWSQSFANINSGTLSTPPLIGEFRNGRGEFFCQDTLNGRTILVRFVWSDITPDSHHVEQSFSDDGGKTWEPNFIANLTRISQ
jgi:hypothetical protein